MNMRCLQLCVVVLSCGVMCRESRISEQPVDPPKTSYEVHDRVDKRYQGDDSKMRVTMLLTNKRGEERKSTLIRYCKETNHLSKILNCYIAAADIRGTSTLTIERKGEDDFQQMYFPSMKKVRRIPAADKGKSWMGSDFNFEDIRRQKLDDFTYSELKSEVVDKQDCYFYTVTPKSEDKSSYGKIENWVRKDIMQSAQAKFYDRKGELVKVLVFKDYQKIDGVWTCMHLEMKNVQDEHKSDFIVEKVIYNTGLEDSLFAERTMLEVLKDI